ncbi:MAG: thioredoxin [Candidatus Omnitrophica bacterium]|nr:thioredoxin [Candidatus Omnitrophota bacterium]
MEVILTDANFEQEILKSDLPCLIDFWAPWCGPCRMVGPVVEEIAKEYQGKLKVGKVNVDEAPKVASQYKIMSIPTLSIFKNGERVDTVVGAVPKEQIISAIDLHL